MPSLRLSIEDARDIASYLVSQKHPDASYAAADYMDDPKLKARGQELVKHFGCAGCHEISGLEDEGRIGTELTNEGSKPIERLDFALFTEDAKRGVLPDGKPSIRGTKSPGSIPRASSSTSSRIPASTMKANTMRITWTPCACLSPISYEPGDLQALVTFLLGSTDPHSAAGIYVQARRPPPLRARGLVGSHEI